MSGLDLSIKGIEIKIESSIYNFHKWKSDTKWCRWKKLNLKKEIRMNKRINSYIQIIMLWLFIPFIFVYTSHIFYSVMLSTGNIPGI